MPGSGSTGDASLIVCNLVSSFMTNQIRNNSGLIIDKEICLRWIIFLPTNFRKEARFSCRRLDSLQLLVK